MYVNHSSQELNFKLIYVGPPAAGKVESLRTIFANTAPDLKSTLYAVAGEHGDETLFFSFTPNGLGQIRGFTVRLHLYTLQGDSGHPASTELLLRGADVVVFVADCRADFAAQNRHALQLTTAAMAQQGRDWVQLPKVLQLSHASAAGARTAEQLTHELGMAGAPRVAGSGHEVDGVFAALKEAARLALLGAKDGSLAIWEPAADGETGVAGAGSAQAGTVDCRECGAPLAMPIGVRSVACPYCAAAVAAPAVDVAAHEAALLGLSFHEIDARMLADMIRRTVAVASRDGERPDLSGVLLSSDGQQLLMVATDGVRLTRYRAPWSGPPLHEPIVVPRRGLHRVLMAVAQAAPRVALAVGDDRLFLRAGGSTLSVKLSTAGFPPWERALPQTVCSRACVNGPLLSQTIRDAARAGARSVFLSPSAAGLDLSSLDGTFRRRVPAESSGSAIHVLLDIELLYSAVQVTQSEQLEVFFAGELAQVVMTPIAGPDVMVVMMPMRPPA